YRHRRRSCPADGSPAGEPPRDGMAGVPARRAPRGGRALQHAVTSPPRAGATRVVARVGAGGAVSRLTPPPALTRAAVDARDAALATELVYGTLRWQRYLDWILTPHSRRRLGSLDPRPRVLLRLTAYQLAFLERIPPFAAVDDAVTLARQRARP